MKTSVVLCTYNGANYIEIQLDSIINQTIKPDEIIVCDDGSKDSTINICRNILVKSKIDYKIIENKTNKGIRDNFNLGITLASGDIIFLSDQDDYWFPKKIEVHKAIYQSRCEIEMIINDCIFTDKNLVTNNTTKIRKIKSWYNLNKSFIQGSCLSFKVNYKNILLPIPKIEIFHDKWISDIFFYLDKKYILREPLQLYRMHESNNSSFKLNKKPLDIFALKQRMKKRSLRKELFHEIKQISIIIERFEKLKIPCSEEKEKLNIIKKSFEDRYRIIQTNNLLQRIYLILKIDISTYLRINNGYYSLIKDIIR